MRTLPTATAQNYWSQFRKKRAYPLERPWHKMPRFNQYLEWEKEFFQDEWDEANARQRWELNRQKVLAEQNRLNKIAQAARLARSKVTPVASFTKQLWKTAPAALAVAAVATASPSKTVCEKRQERKEVLFATGKAGKVGQRSPVWTSLSKVRCK